MTSALNIRNPCKQQLSVKEIMIATTSSGIYRESELSEKYMPKKMEINEIYRETNVILILRRD
jgi:hypothetical protein